MKINEFREKSVTELETLLRDARKSLFTMRLTQHVGQVEKTHLFVQLRRDIARMSTVIRQKSAQA